MRLRITAALAAIALIPTAAASAAPVTPRDLHRAVTAYLRADLRSGYATSYRIDRCHIGPRYSACGVDEIGYLGTADPNADLHTWVVVRRDRAGHLHVSDSLHG